MKRSVSPIPRETLLRSHPITGSVDGWFFRLEETSASVYRVEGMDEYGRRVGCTGTDASEALDRCADDALLVGAPVFVVRDHFDLRQLGLAVVGDEPMSALGNGGPWRAVVRRPDGECVRAIAHRPRFVYRERPEFEPISVTLPDLTRADVPVGSEVFLRRA